MDFIQIDPQNPPNPHKFKHFIVENYELALNQSMQELLGSHNCDFSLASTFYGLMQARANPPLETIWVYSALIFRHRNSPKDEPLDRFSAIRDLFQLISRCSASCSSSTSIGLLAPVIYEMHRVVVDLKGKEPISKRDEKVMRKIKSLVNLILGYISVCCSANDDALGLDSDGLLWSLEDLIHVWIGDGVDETSQANQMFKLFFPLLSDDIVGRLTVEGNVVCELAGAVIAEAFLLRLCLDLCSGVSKQELQKNLKAWTVGSITGFQHFYFFDTLLRILVEHTLPVTSLLSSEDEVSLREVLYDVVILVDYSFLNPDKGIHLPAKLVKNLAIVRVLVTHEAVELFRKKGDQTKALSYINAFSNSQLPSQLIKLIISEIGMDSKAGQPKGRSPKALLKWLFNLEDLGIRLLDDSITKCRSRLALGISEAKHENPAYNAERTKPDADLHFYIDNKGEEVDGSEDNERTKESVNAAFVAAAHTMASTESGGGRKRKERGTSGKKKQIKFLKYSLDDNLATLAEKNSISTLLRNDGSSSGSEVEDQHSEDEVIVEKGRTNEKI